MSMISGKNIVGVVSGCNNYKVIDLGSNGELSDNYRESKGRKRLIL